MEKIGRGILDIRLFPSLEIFAEGKRLLTPRNKAYKMNKLIVRLLLARGEAVTTAGLIAIAGFDADDEMNSLKVLIHRIRKQFEGVDSRLKDCLLYKNGGYAWNMETVKSVDLFEANDICSRVLNAVTLWDLTQEDVYALTEMYSSDILREMADEVWVQAVSAQHKRSYTTAMAHALSLMWQATAIETVIKTCHLGLYFDPGEALFWRNLNKGMSIMEKCDGKISPTQHSWGKPMDWQEIKKYDPFYLSKQDGMLSAQSMPKNPYSQNVNQFAYDPF